jgi:hypothetical protein
MKKLAICFFMYGITLQLSYGQDIPSIPGEENPAVQMDMESVLLPNELNVNRLEIEELFNKVLKGSGAVNTSAEKQGWLAVTGSYRKGKVAIKSLDNHIENSNLADKIKQIFTTEYPKYLKTIEKEIDHTFEFDIAVDENKQQVTELYFRTRKN